MELKINVFRLVAFAALIITIIIGIFILRHQNNAIRTLNDVIIQEQLDDSLQQATDSIKFKQLQLKTFSDSMVTAKLYRDREAELIKKLIKKKIIKYEDIIKELPNSNTATRDSIWKSELTKPEQLIK
jgi:uncharacterized membrane-anchored protein YhcB (DUF1043 family)